MLPSRGQLERAPYLLANRSLTGTGRAQAGPRDINLRMAEVVGTLVSGGAGVVRMGGRDPRVARGVGQTPKKGGVLPARATQGSQPRLVRRPRPY